VKNTTNTQLENELNEVTYAVTNVNESGDTVNKETIHKLSSAIQTQTYLTFFFEFLLELFFFLTFFVENILSSSFQRGSH